MNPKHAVYAAVGAPIVAARALNSRLERLREELDSRGEGLNQRAQRILEDWAEEGRQAMEKVSEGKVVDEFAAKVDLDQAREQVSKLRHRLEDVLDTWRGSFAPETEGPEPVHAPPPPSSPPSEEERAVGALPSEEEAFPAPEAQEGEMQGPPRGTDDTAAGSTPAQEREKGSQPDRPEGEDTP